MKTFNYVNKSQPLDREPTQVTTTGSTTSRLDISRPVVLYPVIVAFSPGQVYDLPGPYDAQLRAVADRFGFIVMTSKYYRNQVPGLWTRSRLSGIWIKTRSEWNWVGWHRVLPVLRQTSRTTRLPVNRC